jgi:putative spermidine/putrescine transport system ATP-binding protein
VSTGQPTLTDQQPPAIRFSGVSRIFGDVRAVDNLHLDILDGEFFTMLGPSGSGKTTTLRLIAGFDQPTSGSIQLYGQEVAGLPPYERDVTTVFQDYALFPHMTVDQNVAYGLMIRKVPKAEREKRVQEMLELVQLPGLAKRKPSQLSGGQRQRVALARALITRPRVLLLDEPLGALDLKLRQQMQIELKALQQKVGITFVYVTHDQEEALTMSDRVAVFNKGKVEQVGGPAELYENPITVFVAGFVGTTNLIRGALAEALNGSPGTFSIRPEKIRMCSSGDAAGPDACSALGQIADIAYLGIMTRYLITLQDGTSMTVVEQNLHGTSSDVLDAAGREVQLIWQREFNRPLVES